MIAISQFVYIYRPPHLVNVIKNIYDKRNESVGIIFYKSDHKTSFVYIPLLEVWNSLELQSIACQFDLCTQLCPSLPL